MNEKYPKTSPIVAVPSKPQEGFSVSGCIRRAALFPILCCFLLFLTPRHLAGAKPEGFVNPIGLGADPWVVGDGERLLWCFAVPERTISVCVSDRIDRIGKRHVVWKAPQTGPCSDEIWAPELHRFDGKWYIYFAASDGDNRNHRAFVLESKTGDPLGDYDLHGPLYTGDDFQGKTNNRWAIDMTVLEHRGKRYAVWSGWQEDKDVQHLFIAPLSDPRTIAAARTRIAENDDHLWERTEETPESRGLAEAPEVLKWKDRTFLTYSCGASWLPTYKVGLLELLGNDPLDRNAWKKHGTAVFSSTEKTYGVGHGCFLPAPEIGPSAFWFVYHAKADRSPGWHREVFVQPITLDERGFPRFGRPVDRGVFVPLSGSSQVP